MVFKNFFQKESSRYIITGVFANLIYFFLYVFLNQIYENIFLISLFSYFIALFFTFLVQRSWTFKTKERNLNQIIRFICVYASSAVIMATIIALLVSLKLNYLLAWITGNSYAIIHNYILSKYYVFK
jgi:putative flippase GtrA